MADTAEEKFLAYYDRFMPTLKYVMENAVPKDLRLLRGKTIECISLIGLAVGQEKVSYTFTVLFAIVLNCFERHITAFFGDLMCCDVM